MSIWNKILIGFIFVASVAFFYLAARALKTHQHWRDIALKLEQSLGDENKLQQTLLGNSVEQQSGEDSTLGIRQATLEVHKLLIDRGRVWYGCRPQQVDPASGAASVMTELPHPPQIKVQTVLFVFDEVDVQNGGRYLGEFTVSAVGGDGDSQIELQPTRKMTPQECTRLAQSQAGAESSWTLCEIMPQDNHEIFEELDEEERRAMLPAATVEEYLSDGQRMTTDEVARQGLQGEVLSVDANGELVRDARQVPVQVEDGEGKYVRKLRDYEVLFNTYHAQWSELTDLLEASARDKAYIEAALENANQQKQFRQTEVDDLKVELAKIERERDAVAAHLGALEGRMAAMRTAIAAMIKDNREKAGEIARIQLEATRRIDERTRRMAQAEAGN